MNTPGTYVLTASEGSITSTNSSSFNGVPSPFVGLSFNGTDGSQPGPIFADKNGNLFGNTLNGGANSSGSIFEVMQGSSAITTLASFDFTTTGSQPQGVMSDANGDLFGVAEESGPGFDGTIFELPKGSSTPNVLFSFSSSNAGTDGGRPVGNLVMDNSGNLFGVTGGGGANNLGTVFEFTPSTSTFTPLVSFSLALGYGCAGNLLIDSAGDLFGTASGGGANNEGVVFEIVHNSNAITDLASFDSTHGRGPQCGLLEDASGNFFGTTLAGGTNDDGTIFELPKGATSVTSLASFNGTNGIQPQGALIEDKFGDLLGTAPFGGAYQSGTLFGLAPGSNTISVLAPFDGANGADPQAGLSTDSNGDVLGTGFSGGANGNGTVFQFSIPPKQVAITQQPTSVLAAGAFSVSAAVEGAFGNVDTLDSSSVTLSIFSGPKGGTLQGTTTARTSFGVVTFSGISVNVAGNYVLQVKDGTLSSGQSSPISVALPRLAFIHEPSNLTVGAVITPGIAVAVEDPSGNILSTDSSSIQLAVSSGPSGALRGTLTVPTQQGIATFPNLFLNAAGSFVISASDATLPAVARVPTNSFKVSVPQLVFMTPPKAGTAGAALPVTVAIEDASGNIMNDGSNVTISIASGPSGAKLSGTTTVQAQNGVAAFTDLSLTTPGNYTLRAVEGSLASITSTSFTVSRDPFATLGAFNGSGGSFPQAKLVMDATGDLFGLADGGGTKNDGTVFEIVHGSGAISTLASFTGTNGSFPTGGLVMDGKGNLFGTASSGGANNKGDVFEVVKNSGTITVPASFSGTNGSFPNGDLVMDANGNLFGTAPNGGANNNGVLFELAKGSSTINALASFDNTTGFPNGGLIEDSTGNFYGVTGSGGSQFDGTIYELVHGGKAVTVLASFTGANGSFPGGTLTMDSKGNLFGAAADGGADRRGTIFELAHGGSTITALASFNGNNGSFPNGQLLLDSSGNLFGTAQDGGGYGDGAVFGLAAGSNAITALASFAGVDGSFPAGGLIKDAAGRLVGAASDGGANKKGTIFQLLPAVAPTQLAFTQQPVNPTVGPLPTVTVSLEAADGSLGYGNTSSVTLSILSGPTGAVLKGTLTEPAHFGVATFADLSLNLPGTYTLQATDGTFTKAVPSTFTVFPNYTAAFNLAFSASGSNPIGDLLMDKNGNIFGTTLNGGDANAGALWEVPHGANSIKYVLSFDNFFTGIKPQAGLIEDAAGDLFGTATGLPFANGSVFELPAGSTKLVALGDFNGSNGSGPLGSPVMDGQGDLFGTTEFGGASNLGTVFEVVHGTTTITTLASFNGTDGAKPFANLVIDQHGDLFGTTSSGGASGRGTVFELGAGSNTITTLASFSFSNGSCPRGGPDHGRQRRPLGYDRRRGGVW